MISKSFGEISGKSVARVTFKLPSNIRANVITLVGDFNNWDTQTDPFRLNGSGVWTITKDLEPQRAYQFRYLVDGKEWLNDRDADAHVHNIYGSDNSVIITDPDYRRYSETNKH